jgi:predicted Zn-dependent peptidase
VDLKRIDDAIKVILEEHYGLASGKKPISEKELTKGKEYLKGHLALSLEDTKAVDGFFGLQELMLGKVETPSDIIDKIDKVTADDVYALAKKFFKPEKLNLAIIGPYPESSRFERLLK